MSMLMIMGLRALHQVTTKEDKENRKQERTKGSDDVRFSDPIIGNYRPNQKDRGCDCGIIVKRHQTRLAPAFNSAVNSAVGSAVDWQSKAYQFCAFHANTLIFDGGALELQLVLSGVILYLIAPAM